MNTRRLWAAAAATTLALATAAALSTALTLRRLRGA